MTSTHLRSIARATAATTAAALFALATACNAPAKDYGPGEDPKLPPSEATAKQALDTTPRHGEFIDVPGAPGGPALRTWISYPETKDKAGVVVVIHEVFGLSDWIRGVADQLAEDGFIAVVPDFISGLGPGGGGTDSVSSRDDVVKLVRSLTPDEMGKRMAAVRAWTKTIPSANGKVATMGFCWGGGQSFVAAASSPAPDAAVVYYGSSPDSATLLAVAAPVLGNYGGDDERVNATIPAAEKSLKAQKTTYDPNVYDGAGHGFLRQQEGRDGANLRATQKAWPKTITFLKKYLR
jgi:carboxymethylenebutenolidase